MNVIRGSPSYKQLKATCDELQRQIALSLAAEQNLFDARNDLDRDLARFRAIQSYSQVAIHAKSVDEFLWITAESIAGAFEVECSALFLYDSSTRRLRIAAAFGFEETVDGWYLDGGWIDREGLWRTGSAVVEGALPIGNSFASWLAQAIVCSFQDANGVLEGLILGGISTAKNACFDAREQKIVPSFTIFTHR